MHPGLSRKAEHGRGGGPVNVLLHADEPCCVCGYRGHWVSSEQVTVNAHSLRRVNVALVVGPTPCPECGTPFKSDRAPRRWRFDPGDAEIIRAYRRRRFKSCRS